MWANQLLTINTGSPTTDITFDFQATPGYVGVERVEVVMFNCPEWGISVDSITLYGSTTTTDIENFLTTITPAITSCDSLVRVCISRSVSSTRTALTLRFHLSPASTWVHLAEVSFYGAGPTCPPDSILNQTSPFTTSGSDQSTPKLPITPGTTTAMGNSEDNNKYNRGNITIIVALVVIAISIIWVVVKQETKRNETKR